MNKITVFVVSHKPLDISKYPDRKIIYVGNKHKFKVNNKNIFIDSVGNNISKLNPYYCELTAFYWVWKNYPKSEYIGFEHYSRNFYMNLFKVASLEFLYTKAKKCDFLHIPKSLHIKSEKSFWTKHEGKNLFSILETSIKKIAPKYYADWLKVMDQGRISYCNMFICKWNDFDKYMKFIFKILNYAFKEIKCLPKQYQLRSIGYMSERLLDAYILHNNLTDKSCLIKIKRHKSK